MRDEGVIKRADAFSSCHPVINLLYFASVIAFSMMLMHPLCLFVSLSGAGAYALYLKGAHEIRRALLYLLPLILFTAALNPLFSHAGTTVLSYFPNGNPLTLESIVFGAASAAMLASAVLWFSCVNVVMTSDKFVCLFGHAAPALSLLLSMTLRFVPRFASKFKETASVRKCLGLVGKDSGIIERFRNGLAVLSAMVTWSLENSIETSDSMKSRGYGLEGRTSFSLYRFDKRDRSVLLWILISSVYVAVGTTMKAVYWRYFPTIQGNVSGVFGVSIFVVYFALCITPAAFDIREDIKWKSLRSKI